MKKGFTLVELLVSITIFLIVIVTVSNFFINSLHESTKQRLKAFKENEIKEVFRIIEDDIRHANFGYDNKTNDNKSIALYALDKCGASSDETFCKPDSSRLFIADGWQIIRDFTQDNCPDGDIISPDYEIILNKFKAEVTSYISGSKKITVNTLNIDSRCRKSSSVVLCGSASNDCNDIKDNKAIIISRCQDSSGNYGVEGRRIGGITGTTINFLTKENSLTYDHCSSDISIVLPAIVWYIRKDSNDIFSLYRNENKVIENIENFTVRIGYDTDGDGLIKDSELYDNIPSNTEYSKLKFFEISIDYYYEWKGKKYLMNSKIRIEAFH